MSYRVVVPFITYCLAVRYDTWNDVGVCDIEVWHHIRQLTQQKQGGQIEGEDDAVIFRFTNRIDAIIFALIFGRG